MLDKQSEKETINSEREKRGKETLRKTRRTGQLKKVTRKLFTEQKSENEAREMGTDKCDGVRRV